MCGEAVLVQCAESGASVRSRLKDSQHEQYVVVSFPGAWNYAMLTVMCVIGLRRRDVS